MEGSPGLLASFMATLGMYLPRAVEEAATACGEDVTPAVIFEGEAVFLQLS